nr:STAS/SEC14 domain-containing protein [Salegentibacter agarivorans]
MGEKEWQQWAAGATEFFASSQVRYFDLTEKEETKRWILKQKENEKITT